MMSDAGDESNILKDSSEMETEVTMEEGSIKVEENEGQIVTVKHKKSTLILLLISSHRFAFKARLCMLIVN